MSLSNQQAKMLANLLTKQQHIAFRYLAGKDDTAKVFVTPELIDELVELELVRRDRTVEDKPRDVVLLTPKGKKVAPYI
jgi:DNA-binding MarR family transcriptional regulator